jgi:hypothetical protein
MNRDAIIDRIYEISGFKYGSRRELSDEEVERDLAYLRQICGYCLKLFRNLDALDKEK